MAQNTRRTIKFRTWDYKNQKILNNFEVDQYCESGTYINHVFQYDDRFIFQQFIGSKDKNGIDICEGDILKAKYYIDTKEVIGEVKYKECSFVLENNEYGDINACIFKGGVEIIGNIFENPELLKPLENKE